MDWDQTLKQNWKVYLNEIMTKPYQLNESSIFSFIVIVNFYIDDYCKANEVTNESYWILPRDNFDAICK